MADATISDLIDRIKAEGQLTRNTGTNSIKVTNMLLLGIKDSAEKTLALLTGQTTILQDFVNDAARLAALAALGNQGGGGGGNPNPPPGTPDDIRGQRAPNIGLLATLGAGAIGAVIGMFKGWINAVKFFTPGKILTAIEGAGSAIMKVVRDFGTMGRNTINGIKQAVLGLDGPLLSIKNGIMYVVKPFVEAGKTIFSIVKNTLGFGDTVSGIAKYFKELLKIIKSVSGIVGKIFLPLTVIMTAFDTIRAAIAGYAEGGIFGALEGAITGFFNSLIFGPLDLIKSAVAWILGKLGFKNAEETLNSFSFSQIFSDLIGGVFGLVGEVINGIKKYFTDVVEGFKTGGVWGGIGAILTGYFDMIVMKPLDLLKDLVSWVLDKLGFKNASETLDSFSFSQIFSDLIGGVFGLIGKVFTAIKTLFSNIMQVTIDGFDFVGSFTMKLVGGIFSVVGDVFTAIKTLFSNIMQVTIDAFDFVGSFTTKLVGGIFSIVGDIFTAIKTLFSNIMQVTIDAFDFVGSFTTKLVGGIFGVVGNMFDAITAYFTSVIEEFKTGGVWGGLGAMLKGYFNLMVMKPLDLLKDLVSWAADLFGFENASKWLDSFSFSEMFMAVVDWISAIPQKLVEYFEDMWIDMKANLLMGMAGFAGWVGGLGDRIYLSILEYLKGTTVGSYLVDDEMVAGARKSVNDQSNATAALQQQIQYNSVAERKALEVSRVQRHAEEAAARAAAAPQTAPNIDARSGGNNTSTTATQVTNYYAGQGATLDGAYLPQ